MGAIGKRPLLRPALDVGAGLAGRLAAPESYANPPRKALIVPVYLVDTNVISAGAPSKALATTDLVKWMDAHSSDLFLSAVTVAEIEDGIAKARREQARRKAANLTAWLEALLHLYGNRILAFDVAAARLAGALSDLARGKGM